MLRLVLSAAAAVLLSSLSLSSCSCTVPPGEGEGEGEEGEGEGEEGEGEGEGAAEGEGEGAAEGEGEGAAEGEGETDLVTLQFLTISDWHGQIDPLVVRNSTTNLDEQIGGAAALGAYFDGHRAQNPNTLVLAGGDSFGGSPPIASFINEEPAVLALNLMGLDYDTFGNHNFDKGPTHLQQMIDLAEYTFVSSNLQNLAAVLTGVESPFHLVTVAGVSVGIVGITNDDAPTLVFPGNLGAITVAPSADAADSARAAAEAAGADVVVALVHMGATGRDAAGEPTGPLIDFANDVSGFDVIVGDHTDYEVNEVINGAIVIENKSKGRSYGRIQLDVRTTSGAVVGANAEILTPLVANVTPRADIGAAMQTYRDQLAVQLDDVIGSTTALFDRGNNVERLAEMPIGNLVTDAYRLRCPSTGSPSQIGFSNGGGLRDKLPSAYVPTTGSPDRTLPDADLVVGDAYSVLPFGNFVVTRTVTGAQLRPLLEHGFSSLPAANGRFPQVSGIEVEIDVTLAAGSRITSLTLADGTPIVDGSTYTFATTDFVNLGGDGYTMLNDGQGTTCALGAEVLAAHIESLTSPLTPATEGRITISNPAGEGEGEGEGEGDAGGFADPVAVTLDFARTLAISPVNDVDCYRFTVPSDGDLEVSVDDGAAGCPADADPEVDLFSTDETLLANDDDSGVDFCAELSTPVFSGEELTLCVRSTDYPGYQTESFGLTVSADFTAQSPGLVLSEVAHRTSSVKYVEIYNATAAPIDLAAAGAATRVKLYFNGNLTAGATIALTGTLNAGQTFILAKDSAAFAAAFTGRTATQQNSNVDFNGNDAVELSVNNVALDAYGDIGVDAMAPNPDLSWAYPFGVAKRNAGITNGRVVFFQNQWVTTPNATLDAYTPGVR